jgi:two-component system OmpR family response regulator
MTEQRYRVLVVEDDPRMGPSIVAGLTRAGFDATLAADGDRGLELSAGERFDLVVLDLMLPGRSGHELLEAWSGRLGAPVIVLTARTELDSRVRSFEGGAVDFIPKPFWMEELVLRVRARLGVSAPRPDRRLSLGEVALDLDAREARRGEEALGLTAHEFNILALLVERAGQVLTRGQIADRALPMEGDRIDRTVDSHISRIRKKLGPEGGCIATVYGVGYRLSLPDSA